MFTAAVWLVINLNYRVLPNQTGSIVEILIKVDKMKVRTSLMRCALVNFDSPD